MVAAEATYYRLLTVYWYVDIYRIAEKQKPHAFGMGSWLDLMPGSVLLSHGETPHYHRRYGVSLLSSAWGQVGPPRYGRQANSVLINPLGISTQPANPIWNHR